MVVAVITDGEENASSEFNISQIKNLIKDKEASGWDFMFLGATLDTIQVAQNMGFAANKAAVYSTCNMEECIGMISSKITQARLGKEVDIAQEDRNNLTATPAT